MSHTVLLYGATGFSGRLIAAEGQQTGMASQDGTPEHRMVLGGRDGNSLKKLADKHKMQYRTFSLDDRDDVRRGLRGVDVLINAAGPFAWTADRLIKGALDEGCHYVDINGEVDVYKKLDDFGRYAAQRERAIVCSAGHTAAASDLLLDAALDHLNYGADLDCGAELGAVRIAMSRVMNLSHGSAETLWRSLREQVTVVRTLEVEDEQGNVTREPTLWHEPVGKLERTFDFRDHGPGNKTVVTDLRIASAANLVDTLTARLTVARRKFSAKRIESYVEAGTVARIGYQLGTLLAPVAAIPWVRFLAGQQIGLLPSGPTKQELRDDKQIVLLEIEDPLRTKIIDWRWETPNAYQFTAQVVVEIARETVKGAAVGWLTPGAVLRPRKDQLTGKEGALRDCRLDDRIVLNPRTA
jgi:short subunit dehydrogenase-like uncharacterized protein